MVYIPLIIYHTSRLIGISLLEKGDLGSPNIGFFKGISILLYLYRLWGRETLQSMEIQFVMGLTPLGGLGFRWPSKPMDLVSQQAVLAEMGAYQSLRSDSATYGKREQLKRGSESQKTPNRGWELLSLERECTPPSKICPIFFITASTTLIEGLSLTRFTPIHIN